MVFRPVLPATGLAGWSYLQRTLDAQKESLAASPLQERDAAYFREKIGNVASAEELVADRTLLRVALGAFGLEGDLDKRALIRKVLEEGTEAADSLANRLPDKRYAALAESFGFGDPTGPRTQDPGFADTILSAYKTQQFEAAVGEVDASMRLALALEGGLETVLENGTSANTHWYAVLGTTSLRNVFETAFGLPSSFGAIDIDQQVEVLRDKAQSYFGVSEIADIAQPETVEKLRRQFLIRADAAAAQASARSPALTLLQGSGSAAGLLSVLYSS